MVRRILALLLLVPALGLLAAGCGDDDDGNGGNDPSLTSEEPTEGPPAATSGSPGGGGDESDPIRTAVFERSYSECATKSVKELSELYGVDEDREAVAKFIGQRWARQYEQPGAARIERAGRDACLQAFDSQR